jgi:hypothetical protein
VLFPHSTEDVVALEEVVEVPEENVEALTMEEEDEEDKVHEEDEVNSQQAGEATGEAAEAPMRLPIP